MQVDSGPCIHRQKYTSCAHPSMSAHTHTHVYKSLLTLSCTYFEKFVRRTRLVIIHCTSCIISSNAPALWWIARVTQGHLVCISMHQVSDSYFITRPHISGRFLISFFFPFSKAPRRPLAFATCFKSKVALFLNAIVSGSPSKCCWIHKINDSILPAILRGFKFFPCFYWTHSLKSGLEDLCYLLCILYGKVFLFWVMFGVF